MTLGTRIWFFMIFLLSLMIAGCTSGGIEATRVGREMINSRSEGPDLILGDAVFTVTRGQSVAEAISTLTADGATCSSYSCAWSYLEKESIWSVLRPDPQAPLRT